MEVHVGKGYRLINIGRYRRLWKLKDSITQKRLKPESPNFVYKEIGLRTIVNDLENQDPRQVVYTKFGSQISDKSFDSSI